MLRYAFYWQLNLIVLSLFFGSIFDPYYINYTTMSTLIDMEYDYTNNNPEILKQCITSIFKTKDINGHLDRNTAYNQIMFIVKSSPTAYRLATLWKFYFYDLFTKIQIFFYNKDQSDFLRAYTDRTRIETSILVRSVNAKTMPNFVFTMDIESGILKMFSSFNWGFLNETICKKQYIEMKIHSLFKQIRKYDELVLFVEPTFNVKQIRIERDPIEKINRLKALLKRTKNARKQIHCQFNDLIKEKELREQRNVFNKNIQQTMIAYMRNIVDFQKSTLGLEDVNGYQLEKIDNEIFSEQLDEVQKNNFGFTSAQRQQRTSDRIISGLLKIESDQQNEQMIYNQEGAHSSIFRKNFRYIIVETIYDGTYREFMFNKKQCKGKLTYKKCNKTHQPSINSFKNQIHTLTYMKDMASPWVASYYLEVKQNWDESDTIYMNNYKKDVYTLLKNCTKMSIKSRLKLSYKIAKGLCFLHSKKILHRDFKPQNIVIDSNLSPKIIDFGSSISYGIQGVDRKFKVFDERLLTTQGYNIQYLNFSQNHELRQKYRQSDYDQHELFDVYSFGRTLSFIFFGDINPPLADNLDYQKQYQILQQLIFLINKCISYDPDDRPGYGQMTAFLGSLVGLIQQDLTAMDSETNM